MQGLDDLVLTNDCVILLSKDLALLAIANLVVEGLGYNFDNAYLLGYLRIAVWLQQLNQMPINFDRI